MRTLTFFLVILCAARTGAGQRVESFRDCGGSVPFVPSRGCSKFAVKVEGTNAVGLIEAGSRAPVLYLSSEYERRCVNRQ